jgi:1-acyl-sn-glycerol-3-phosphate acyltransferase
MQDSLTTYERLQSRGICVIIPTFNNAGTIADVVRRSLLQCHDIIVVNDGSTDNTEDILHSIAGITILTLPKNGGKGYALKQGFKKARSMGFRYAITLDADGQHYPEDIPTLLHANIQHPHSIIVGERKDLDSQERSAGSKFANAFSNFWFCIQTGRRLRDTQTGYRLYPLKHTFILTSRYEAELELLVFASWHGVAIHHAPVRVYYPPQHLRVSHFRPVKDFSRIFILNTCLCIMALVYGLPRVIIRCMMTFLRTTYSLLFFLVGSILLLFPAAYIYPLIQRNSERLTWHLHRHLHFIGKLVIKWHGIPGVKYSVSNPNDEDFTKPAMVICNHQSPLDLMAMLALTPRLAILTKDWVYNNPFFGRILRKGEYYPVSMGIDELMPRLQSLISRGYSIMIFPEGTRSADCSIQRFHKGAFQIAHDLNIDILPLMLYAPGKVLPKGGKYLHKGMIHTEIGQRISPEVYNNYGDIKAIASHFRADYKQWYSETDDSVA